MEDDNKEEDEMVDDDQPPSTPTASSLIHLSFDLISPHELRKQLMIIISQEGPHFPLLDQVIILSHITIYHLLSHIYHL